MLATLTSRMNAYPESVLRVILDNFIFDLVARRGKGAHREAETKGRWTEEVAKAVGGEAGSMEDDIRY